VPQPVLGRLYTVVVLRDRPEVRQLVRTLVGAPFATAIASGLCREGIFPVRDAPVPTDCVAAPEAERLRAALHAGTFRVRAIDLLPAQVASGFRDDVNGYLWTAAREGGAPNLDEWAAWSADVSWNKVRAAGPP
jgi:hypothetical protein